MVSKVLVFAIQVRTTVTVIHSAIVASAVAETVVETVAVIG